MKRQNIISALVIFLYLIVIFFSPASYINRPKFLFLDILKSPLAVTNKIFFNLNKVIRSGELIQENLTLRKTVDILTQEIIKQKEMESENERLRKLIDFRQNYPNRLIAARVISRDSSNLSNTIVIDKGKKSGIKENTVAIAEAGLVGRISSVSADMGRVVLITDPNSRVSATVSRSRQTGMLYGRSSGFCEMRYITLDADIKVGDEVVTSGFSFIYPKSIFIGTVIKIQEAPGGLSLTALVRPAVDLANLEEVLCIE